jgi:excinuclease ABC subunit C
VSPRKRKSRSASAAIEARVDSLHQQVKAEVRQRPGVYRMVSPDGEILYVGKAKNLRTRLLGYFRAAYPAEKSARIVREAGEVHWDYLPSEFAALVEELRLIKRFRPRLNVMMKRDARHFAFIRITAGPAPKFMVVRGAGNDEHGTYFGPFHGAWQLEEALRELNDVLGLRDCRLDLPMHFADQVEMPVAPRRTPGCIRYEIGKCLGPCVAAVTQRQYRARITVARDFLEGRQDSPLETLRSAMEESSKRLEFERAAQLRDKMQRLESLREQFERLRFAVESLSFVYTVPGHGDEHRAYIVRRGRIRADLPAPQTPDERSALAVRAAEIFAPAELKSATVPAHEVDELMLLSSWFRKFPAELERTVPAEEYPRMRTA